MGRRSGGGGAEVVGGIAISPNDPMPHRLKPSMKRPKSKYLAAGGVGGGGGGQEEEEEEEAEVVEVAEVVVVAEEVAAEEAQGYLAKEWRARRACR